ncbi:uncharacterized protein LY89DRAFT_769397 [Mollisia scopiformis]|uniref:Uncharacterized protein n=1 Tax=Mollisia scopiformis TaxID=149040 RepID=A0A132B280_MOLSC|nr:uncharacterized protein LY89DRAFT_769397 [Mollisia scopiformis]KUJ06496.1 hypothetical protein LY89DRAFT_769397 [Mollisia scopiformis]
MAIDKSEQDEDQQLFLPKDPEDNNHLPDPRSKKPNLASRFHLRLILEVLMALVMVMLYLDPFSKSTKKPTPVPAFSTKSYTFLQNPRYLHEDMFSSRKETLHTLHNWIELSSDGRGYVQVDNSTSFKLGEPYTMHGTHTDKKEPVYMMSVFHQLHCVSYLAEHYQTELTQEVAHHTAHCFDYIRQAIMCAADTTLEGKTEAGPGFGHEHVCKDYDEVLAWANEHTVFKWRGNMPLEAVL